jgi:hypothetical protein
MRLKEIGRWSPMRIARPNGPGDPDAGGGRPYCPQPDKNGLYALRLTILDLWEESFLVSGLALLGGVLTLPLFPLPFVLTAHSGTAAS